MGDLMDIDWPNAPHTLATPMMQPPAKARKRKAPTLKDGDWAPYRGRIEELYALHPLKNVRSIIESETEFRATERQYKTRIDKWNSENKNIHKNIKTKDMKSIVRKIQRRAIGEPDKAGYRVRVNQNEVPPAKIHRWMQMHSVPEDELYEPSSAASTPSAVDCRTISEVGTPGSRSFTPVPMFNALLENNFDEGAAPDLDNHSNSDTRFPDSRSPTPTPTLYGHDTGLTPSPPPSVMVDNNEESISVKMIEDIVRPSWIGLYFGFNTTGMSFSDTQFSYCKDVTNQYIQGSPNPDAARCAVLDIARMNLLFMPHIITDITAIRKLLQYWLDIGYDINQRDSYRNTLFLQACSRVSIFTLYTPARHWTLLVSLLVQLGANVHDTSLQNGRGALHLAMESIANPMIRFSFHPNDKALIEEAVEVLVVLLEAGCDPSAQDSDGAMPLDMINTEHKARSYYWKAGRDLAKKAWGIALAKTGESRRLRAENAQASSSHSPIVIEDDDF